MKKKVIVIISIIVLLVFIPLAIVGGIKYRNYVAEIEAVELPEIVFERSVVNTDDTCLCRIIDKEGNIYSSKKFWTANELFQMYKDNRLNEEFEYVGEVNLFVLKNKYKIFLDLVANPEYEVIEPTEVPDYFAPSYSWWGYYYNSNEEVDVMLFYENYFGDYEVTDERGKELADWITDAVLN